MSKVSGYYSLVDVAKKAGVSLATASRVLNNTDYPVSNNLRQKVLQSAKELNYLPNSLGKMLKQNTSNAIGIIVPTIQNPYYNQVIIGIEAAAASTGREIRLFSSHRSIKQERNCILELLSTRTMSLIIASIDTSEETLNNYILCGGRVALLESNLDIMNAINVQTDTYKAGKMAAEHLIDMGHQDIAFLSSPITKPFRSKIYMGIKDCLHSNHIPFSESNLFIADDEQESSTGMYEFEIGRRLTEQLLDSHQHITAIIAINDITAFGVIQTLNKRGLSVPKDMSIIGFDNIVYSEMISPPLTTVAFPAEDIGSTSCSMLIDFENRNSAHGVILTFPCSLIKRDSVCNIRR